MTLDNYSGGDDTVPGVEGKLVPPGVPFHDLKAKPMIHFPCTPISEEMPAARRRPPGSEDIRVPTGDLHPCGALIKPDPSCCVHIPLMNDVIKGHLYVVVPGLWSPLFSMSPSDVGVLLLKGEACGDPGSAPYPIPSDMVVMND